MDWEVHVHKYFEVWVKYVEKNGNFVAAILNSAILALKNIIVGMGIFSMDSLTLKM